MAAKPKKNVRVCVLAGRMVWCPPLPGRECTDLIHSHMTFEKADAMVDEGAAEWITIDKVKKNGEKQRVRQNAIRLLPRRKWKGAVSDRSGSKPMKVMQLVS
jgi:hypothetical protein